MSTQNKPREFHILDSEYENQRRCYLGKPVNQTTIHVIEYSAYEHLKAELKESNDSWQRERLSAANYQVIEQLKSKLEIAKKGLEFYAECGEIWSSPTVDADGDFDGAVFKFSGENGLKETARQALKEINDDAVFAKCEYCKKPIDGHLAEHYKDIEVFCSLKCNQEYEG